MGQFRRIAVFAALCALPALAAEDVETAVEGTVKKVDSGTKTVVVAAKDGSEYTIHYVGRTAVHGSEAGAKETVHGLKEGSQVVVHYTSKGAVKTADEIDRVGEGGLKVGEGTVKTI